MIPCILSSKPEVLHQSSINGRNPTNYFSLGLDLHQGACSKFLSRLVHLFRYCQHQMRLEGLMAQCNKKSIHHPIAKCKCISHTIMFLWSTLVCLKLWFYVFLNNNNTIHIGPRCIMAQICIKVPLVRFYIQVG
jgi:hypothetical protein